MQQRRQTDGAPAHHTWEIEHSPTKDHVRSPNPGLVPIWRPFQPGLRQ